MALAREIILKCGDLGLLNFWKEGLVSLYTSRRCSREILGFHLELAHLKCKLSS